LVNVDTHTALNRWQGQHLELSYIRYSSIIDLFLILSIAWG
jgi:hypothetical protein